MSCSLHQVAKAEDTTLIAEGEEELKSLLMRVNEESYFTMYFFNKYCLTVYYGPGTIVDTECTAISRQNCLSFWSLQCRQQIRKHTVCQVVKSEVEENKGVRKNGR